MNIYYPGNIEEFLETQANRSGKFLGNKQVVVIFFEQFFRATNAKKLGKIGTGLGLYLAKNIVEAHGGTMSFVSKENEGTTFSFKLQIK